MSQTQLQNFVISRWDPLPSLAAKLKTKILLIFGKERTLQVRRQTSPGLYHFETRLSVQKIAEISNYQLSR